MAATALRGRRLLDRLFVRSHVAEIEQVAARMRRIWPGLQAPQVRVLVSDMFSFEKVRHAFRDALRTSSVWDHDPASATLDLCVLEHGDWPGARWSKSLVIGDEVAFRQPEASLVLHAADHHVFIGEQTASVTFGATLRTVPPSAQVYGAMEIDSAADRLKLHRGDQLTGPTAAAARRTARKVCSPPPARWNYLTPPASSTWPEKPRPAPPSAVTSSTIAVGRPEPAWLSSVSGLPGSAASSSRIRGT